MHFITISMTKWIYLLLYCVGILEYKDLFHKCFHYRTPSLFNYWHETDIWEAHAQSPSIITTTMTHDTRNVARTDDIWVTTRFCYRHMNTIMKHDLTMYAHDRTTNHYHDSSKRDVRTRDHGNLKHSQIHDEPWSFVIPLTQYEQRSWTICMWYYVFIWVNWCHEFLFRKSLQWCHDRQTRDHAYVSCETVARSDNRDESLWLYYSYERLSIDPPRKHFMNTILIGNEPMFEGR